jgi:hypothetical protein
MENLVKTLIGAEQIKFLYDPIDDSLVEKNTVSTDKVRIYKRAVKAINDFVHKKKLDMLK